MDTVKVPFNLVPLSLPHKVRAKTEEEWINDHASGTLRKNRRLGMKYKTQYLQERAAFEFGHEFQLMPSTRVTWNDAMTYGDCKPITEAGWYSDKLISMCPFAEDVYEVKYIIVEDSDGKRTEGIGIVVKKTSALFVPDSGYILFAIITEYCKNSHDYFPAKNPC